MSSKKPDPPAPRIDPLASAAIAPPEAPLAGPAPAPTLRGKALPTPEGSTVAAVVEEPSLPPVGGLAPPPRRAPRYEVLRPITLSWGVGFIRLSAGDQVSDETHGDGAVARMREGGTALREV